MSTTNHRRERGYAFEKHIVDFFNNRRFDYGGNWWYAQRLGGTSTKLPDIIVTNNDRSVIFSIEAKSTVGKIAYIPNDQIVRCIDILDMFSIYDQRNVVFAFKFAKSACNRSLKYCFFRFHTFNLKHVKVLTCTNTGYLSLIRVNKGQELNLSFNRYEDIKMLRDMHSSPFSESL